jgi:hypothetical protein
MKATIYLDGKEIFNSNKISAKNLDKKENELKTTHACLKMVDRVKKGFKLFTHE